MSKKYIPKYHIPRGGKMRYSKAFLDAHPEYKDEAIDDDVALNTVAKVAKDNNDALASQLMEAGLPTDSLDMVKVKNPYTGESRTVPKYQVEEVKDEYSQDLRRKMDEKASPTAKAFDKINRGLRDVADWGVNLLPEPLQAVYQTFRPSDNAFLSTGGKMNIKELRHYAKLLKVRDHEKMKKHELVHALKGEGLWDWLPVVKDKIKGYINKIPEPIKKGISYVFNLSRNISSFNKRSKKTLEEYGNKPIKSIKIFKEKIDGLVRKAISVISDSKGNLYHLGLLITLDDGTEITVDKDHVVNVHKGSPIKSTTEVLDVDLKGKNITMNELLDKAIETVGKDQIFEYSALGGRNCQNFVVDVLNSSGLLTKAQEKWTLQSLQDLKDKSRLGDDTEAIVKGLTDTRNAIDNLTGFGVKRRRNRRKN
jgi:hypothetical protein